MARRSNRMERRDNYEKALREEDEALRASMGKRAEGGSATAEKDATKKPTPIAPRWARAKREADKKKKP
jgi:hypothetical protein